MLTIEIIYVKQEKLENPLKCMVMITAPEFKDT